jgi:cell division protein ZapA (FtsZ GTPase activity inhibitor)
MHRIADIITIVMIGALLIATCLVSQERGTEASSIQAQIHNLEAQIAALKPIPRITVERASIYPIADSEIIVDVVRK